MLEEYQDWHVDHLMNYKLYHPKLYNSYSKSTKYEIMCEDFSICESRGSEGSQNTSYKCKVHSQNCGVKYSFFVSGCFE